MKTENFDDSVRSKSEDGLPLYRDEELDRVQNYVSRNQTNDDKKGSLLFGLYALAGFLLSGLLLWDIVQYKENNELTQALSSMKEVHAKLKAGVERPKEESIAVRNSFIDRKEYHAKKKNSENLSTNTEQANYLSNGNSGLQGEKLPPAETGFDDSGAGREDKETSNVEKAQIEPVSKESEQHIQTVDSIVIASAVVVQQVDPVPVPTGNKYPHFLAGAGIEVANGQNAVSIVGEMMLNNKWSISAGIKLVQIDDDGVFFDNESFENSKEHDYSPPCTTCSSDSGPHQDVHYKYTLLQIPLALHYYIALKNDFALSVGLGTDLDVYARQQLDLDNYAAGIPANLNWTSRCPTLVFNNAKISFGMQKQWKHFVMRAIPFVSKQLTVVDYKAEAWYYGLQLSGLYVF